MENILPLNIKTKQDLLELRLLVMIILKIESRIESLITLNKKTLGNIIDKRKNKKVQESKGYEYWATKHNIKTISDTVLLIRKKGIKSALDLDKVITETADTQLKI